MKSVFITGISICLLLSVYSQKHYGNSDGISKSDMNGEFAIQFSETNTKYFLAVDLGQLNPDQKSKFESLVFDDKQLVAISSPNNENIWYLSAMKIYLKEDILLSLFKFKEKAMISTSEVNTKYN